MSVSDSENIIQSSVNRMLPSQNFLNGSNVIFQYKYPLLKNHNVIVA